MKTKCFTSRKGDGQEITSGKAELRMNSGKDSVQKYIVFKKEDPEGWYGEGGGFRMGNTCFKIIKLKIKKNK